MHVIYFSQLEVHYDGEEDRKLMINEVGKQGTWSPELMQTNGSGAA